MSIELFYERGSLESRILQLCVRQRQWLTEERLAKLEQLIPRKQAILAEAVAERQELLDNPNRLYWRPASRINPICTISLSPDTFSFPFASPTSTPFSPKLFRTAEWTSAI